VWKRPERRHADADKHAPMYLSAQGTHFHGLSKRSAEDEGTGARPKMRARSSARPVWTKKYKEGEEDERKEGERKEWPLVILIFSCCEKMCCWNGDEKSKPEATLHIDCTYGYNADMKDTEHDGRHHTIQNHMLDAKAVAGVDFEDICRRVKKHLAKNSQQENCSIGLWTPRGRNRAVAVAELLFSIMAMAKQQNAIVLGAEKFFVDIEHCALNHHEIGHTVCTACDKSRIAVTTENWVKAKTIWDKLP
jgi:hypothetical protein